MYMDVKDFCKTCDVCHKSKRDFAHRTRPLNPLPVAQGPFKIWNIDHKDLCGTSFCSKFFSTLMTLLNVKHRISAARAPRSNGLAESLVKRLSDLIKIYVKTDSEIEDYLPLIEMILRSTTHSKLKISPHEVYFGS